MKCLHANHQYIQFVEALIFINIFSLTTGLNIFGLFEDSDVEFLPTAVLSIEPDPSKRSQVWFSSYGKSVQLFLVLFKPYIDLKVEVSLKPSTCTVITVQPCFDIDETERRIKEYNIHTELIHFAEKVSFEEDPIADKYFNYHHHEKICKMIQTERKLKVFHYKHDIYVVLMINLQRAPCLTFQILPVASNFTVYPASVNLLKRKGGGRIQTVCNYYFIITSPMDMNFRGYYVNNFATRDLSRADILSSSGAMTKHVIGNEMAASFNLSGQLVIANLVMDTKYFLSPIALLAQTTETIARGNFKFQMSRIKEQPHELIVLFWSILSINILQNTNDIDQCKKIDIKMLPSTDKINETYTCTDAFVKLNFYQGNYIFPSSRSLVYCRFVDFTCKTKETDVLVAWYKINCNESRQLSFVVDTKISFKVGDKNLIYPRNIEFEILHEMNGKDLYRESSDFIGLTIRNTTECFNPRINFGENGRTNMMISEGKKYIIFHTDDVVNHTSYNNFVDPPENNLTWNLTKEFCESQGLHLLTIGDAEEERTVLSLLSQKSPGRSDMTVSVYL